MVTRRWGRRPSQRPTPGSRGRDWAPSRSPLSPWECQAARATGAAQSGWVHPGEAQEPSSGTAQGGAWPCCGAGGVRPRSSLRRPRSPHSGWPPRPSGAAAAPGRRPPARGTPPRDRHRPAPSAPQGKARLRSDLRAGPRGRILSLGAELLGGPPRVRTAARRLKSQPWEARAVTVWHREVNTPDTPLRRRPRSRRRAAPPAPRHPRAPRPSPPGARLR